MSGIFISGILLIRTPGIWMFTVLTSGTSGSSAGEVITGFLNSAVFTGSIFLCSGTLTEGEDILNDFTSGALIST